MVFKRNISDLVIDIKKQINDNLDKLYAWKNLIIWVYDVLFKITMVVWFNIRYIPYRYLLVYYSKYDYIINIV